MNQKKYILGIDPGLHGALAYLDIQTGKLTVLGMPTTEKQITKKKFKTILDRERLRERLDRDDILHVYIEKPMTRQGESAASGCTTGINWGYTIGILDSLGIANTAIHPSVWKKVMGATSDKDQTRARASLNMPRAKHLWQRKGQDGVAEAALLCLYASAQLNITHPEVFA